MVGMAKQISYLLTRQFFLVMYALESDGLTYRPVHKSPFSIEGAANVVLETIKRGEDDPKKNLTRVVLRIYEAYGGHASATLRIANHLKIDRAYICNLLEEKVSGLDLVTQEATGDTLISLRLRGFQILTVRLTIAKVTSPSYVSSPIPRK
jgi:alpha-mannosidase